MIIKASGVWKWCQRPEDTQSQRHRHSFAVLYSIRSPPQVLHIFDSPEKDADTGHLTTSATRQTEVGLHACWGQIMSSSMLSPLERLPAELMNHVCGYVSCQVHKSTTLDVAYYKSVSFPILLLTLLLSLSFKTSPSPLELAIHSPVYTPMLSFGLSYSKYSHPVASIPASSISLWQIIPDC